MECLDERAGRFRQTHHSAIDQGPARQRLHFQGLLGGHRDHPRLLRGEPRPDGYCAAIQFLRAGAPIYTHPRFLPGSKINGATLRQAIISDGCIISDAHIERSVIGVRSIIQSGATIRNSIVMGADYFERRQRGDSRRRAADWDRAQLRDRSRHHRQERAHRRWRCHYAGRQTAGFRRGKLFHPRWDRGRAEKRGDSGRILDLTAVSDFHRADSGFRRPIPTAPVCSKEGWIPACVPGSLTRTGGSFCDAQPARAVKEQSRSRPAMIFRCSRICANINDGISRLHLHTSGQATANDIADGGRRFN